MSSEPMFSFWSLLVTVLRMTGVGGRPEIILEGHPSERSAPEGWRTYEFLYKPGNMSETPAVVGKTRTKTDKQ